MTITPAVCEELKADLHVHLPCKVCRFTVIPRVNYDLWQRRFWEHTIKDEDDLRHHVDYIHYNPVKHGLVLAPCDWLYSSLHRFVQQGVLDSGWGAGLELDDVGEYGE